MATGVPPGNAQGPMTNRRNDKGTAFYLASGPLHAMRKPKQTLLAAGG